MHKQKPLIEYSQKPQVQRWIEKVPYERKIIQFQQYQYEEEVPVQVSRIQYQQVKRIQYVPVQKKITDYYVVQVTKTLIPQVKPQIKKQLVPIQHQVHKVVYKPIKKKIIHKPDQTSTQSSKQRGGIDINSKNYQIVLIKRGVPQQVTISNFNKVMQQILGEHWNQQRVRNIWTNTSSSQRAKRCQLAQSMDQLAREEIAMAQMLSYLLNQVYKQDFL